MRRTYPSKRINPDRHQQEPVLPNFPTLRDSREKNRLSNRRRDRANWVDLYGPTACWIPSCKCSRAPEGRPPPLAAGSWRRASQRLWNPGHCHLFLPYSDFECIALPKPDHAEPQTAIQYMGLADRSGAWHRRIRPTGPRHSIERFLERGCSPPRPRPADGLRQSAHVVPIGERRC